LLLSRLVALPVTREIHRRLGGEREVTDALDLLTVGDPAAVFAPRSFLSSMVPTGRAKGAWGYVATAGIKALLGLPWVLGFAVVLGVLYWWGYLGPSEAKPEPHRAEAQCQYPQHPKGGAKALKNTPTVIVCFNGGPNAGAAKAAKDDEAPPKQIGPLSRYVARRVLADPVALFTVVLALFTWRLIVVGRDQHKAAMGALDLARDEFASTHRPRIRVRNINVKKVGSDPVRPVDGLDLASLDQPFTGQFYVSNIGGSTATVIDAYLGFWVGRTALPMERPYEGKDGNLLVPRVGIPAGGSSPILFDQIPDALESEKPPSFDARETRLYVMGWVEYLDIEKRVRRTAFCRHYDPKKQRFVLWDEIGLDYESED